MAYPVLAHWTVRVKDEVPLSGPQPLQSSIPTIPCSVLQFFSRKYKLGESRQCFHRCNVLASKWNMFRVGRNCTVWTGCTCQFLFFYFMSAAFLFLLCSPAQHIHCIHIVYLMKPHKNVHIFWLSESILKYNFIMVVVSIYVLHLTSFIDFVCCYIVFGFHSEYELRALCITVFHIYILYVGYCWIIPQLNTKILYELSSLWGPVHAKAMMSCNMSTSYHLMFILLVWSS